MPSSQRCSPSNREGVAAGQYAVPGEARQRRDAQHQLPAAAPTRDRDHRACRGDPGKLTQRRRHVIEGNVLEHLATEHELDGGVLEWDGADVAEDVGRQVTRNVERGDFHAETPEVVGNEPAADADDEHARRWTCKNLVELMPVAAPATLRVVPKADIVRSGRDGSRHLASGSCPWRCAMSRRTSARSSEGRGMSALAASSGWRRPATAAQPSPTTE